MESSDIIKAAFSRNSDVLKKSIETILPDMQKAAELLADVAKNDKTMFACGNGGSAADASHLVGEWLCRYKSERGPLRAVALSSEISAVTAIGNDYGFENIFARQLQALGSKGDVLVVFTTSGKSPNVLKALEGARARGVQSIMLTGENGIVLKGKADIVIAVPSTETARIQEIHQIIFHSWCEYIDAALAK